MSEPRVGWTWEQRAAVKQYLWFAAVFAVIGVAFSIFLISAGNHGGWTLLGIVGCACVVGCFIVRKGRTGEPDHEDH